MSNQSPATIYTVGHGRHAFADFLGLLKRHNVKFVVDVRSVARSRWPQFNGLVLAELLNENGIGYEHLPETGGKIKRKPEELTAGIERILEIASELQTAIMCSESQPLTAHKKPRANCHRVGMLAPRLKAIGVRVIHIMPNGETLEFDESPAPSLW